MGEHLFPHFCIYSKYISKGDTMQLIQIINEIKDVPVNVTSDMLDEIGVTIVDSLDSFKNIPLTEKESLEEKGYKVDQISDSECKVSMPDYQFLFLDKTGEMYKLLMYTTPESTHIPRSNSEMIVCSAHIVLEGPAGYEETNAYDAFSLYKKVMYSVSYYLSLFKVDAVKFGGYTSRQKIMYMRFVKMLMGHGFKLFSSDAIHNILLHPEFAKKVNLTDDKKNYDEYEAQVNSLKLDNKANRNNVVRKYKDIGKIAVDRTSVGSFIKLDDMHRTFTLALVTGLTLNDNLRIITWVFDIDYGAKNLSMYKHADEAPIDTIPLMEPAIWVKSLPKDEDYSKILNILKDVYAYEASTTIRNRLMGDRFETYLRQVKSLLAEQI